MPPIDTSALAAIFTSVGSEYAKSILDKAGRAVWERLRWEDRARAYGEKVQRLYGTMQILGQARPVPLEGIYTAVSLLDRPIAWRRYTIEEMQAEFIGQGRRQFHEQDKEKRRDGLELVRGGESLFILGKPGAGKTTFLKHVALRGVSSDLGRVPIFIGLKQLSDSGLSVFDFVVNEFDVCNFPDAAAYLDRLLKAGRATLLFDGLDEVNVADDERRRLISDVENFTRKYDDCQRLITCRLAADDYHFQGYTHVEMADFDQVQIRGFVSKWFDGDAKQRERRDLFLSELDMAGSEGLRELARVPLLLALLCLGFEETLKLSSRRVELYKEALDVLLKKWDSSRNIRRDEVYRELSLQRKEQMLAQVAAETFDRAEYFIPGRSLARSFESYLARLPNALTQIDGDDILRAIVAQHGLFLERAHGIYSFAHLTFQEYFTARYIVDNEARGALPRLIKHYADSRYHEVFLLTAAQLPDASKFIELFIAHLSDEVQIRPSVATLLRSIEPKAAKLVEAGIGANTARSLFVHFAIDLSHILYLTDDLIRSTTCDIVYDLDIAHDLDLALARTFDGNRGRELSIAYEQALARAYSRTRAFDLVLDVVRAIDYSRHHFFSFAHEETRNKSKVFNRALDPNLTLALELSTAHGLASDFYYDRGATRTQNIDIVPKDNNTRALDAGRADVNALRIYNEFARDLTLAYCWQCVEASLAMQDQIGLHVWISAVREFALKAAQQSELLGDVEGQGQLTNIAERISSHNQKSYLSDVLQLQDELRAFMDARHIMLLRLDKQDLASLRRYLEGHLVLLECLDQAIVSDREAIKDRLLLLSTPNPP
jgi:hypothetical protein